jgi:hypothetical protein
MSQRMPGRTLVRPRTDQFPLKEKRSTGVGADRASPRTKTIEGVHSRALALGVQQPRPKRVPIKVGLISHSEGTAAEGGPAAVLGRQASGLASRFCANGLWPLDACGRDEDLPKASYPAAFAKIFTIQIVDGKKSVGFRA